MRAGPVLERRPLSVVAAQLPLHLLQCPQSGEPLAAADGALQTRSGQRYPMSPTGIVLFAQQPQSGDARRQMAHYDTIAATYEANLGYPHTRAYLAHLDAALVAAIGDAPLGRLVEICCGTGEAFHLLAGRYQAGIGIDISPAMLERAQAVHRGAPVVFLQGDATRLPLADAVADTVVTLGGVHHVNDRAGFFAEIHRVLRPGGRFVFREPVSDFALWRWLRAVIYRVSPMLDAETERPITYADTVPVLERAGFAVEHWSTHGFVGFCLFMNSDVLVFNRLFRHIPGIAGLTRAFARIDDLTLRLPGLSGAGLQAVGIARKPA